MAKTNKLAVKIARTGDEDGKELSEQEIAMLVEQNRARLTGLNAYFVTEETKKKVTLAGIVCGVAFIGSLVASGGVVAASAPLLATQISTFTGTAGLAAWKARLNGKSNYFLKVGKLGETASEEDRLAEGRPKLKERFNKHTLLIDAAVSVVLGTLFWFAAPLTLPMALGAAAGFFALFNASSLLGHFIAETGARRAHKEFPKLKAMASPAPAAG